MHGIVLTSAPTTGYVRNVIAAGNYNSLKVVSGPEWGIGGSPFSQSHRIFLSSYVKHLLVRTRRGDGLGPHPYPNWEQVLEEVRPWYQAIIKGYTQLDIEIGNEPDKNVYTDPAGYAWHLERAISVCRSTFPECKIVSPAISDTGLDRWYSNEEFVSAISKCDYIGVHQYAFYSLAMDDTKQGKLIKQHVKIKKPLVFSEVGINDAATQHRVKIGHYKAFYEQRRINTYSTYDYHLCTTPNDIDQRNYALTLQDYR